MRINTNKRIKTVIVVYCDDTAQVVSAAEAAESIIRDTDMTDEMTEYDGNDKPQGELNLLG